MTEHFLRDEETSQEKTQRQSQKENKVYFIPICYKNHLRTCRRYPQCLQIIQVTMDQKQRTKRRTMSSMEYLREEAYRSVSEHQKTLSEVI